VFNNAMANKGFFREVGEMIKTTRMKIAIIAIPLLLLSFALLTPSTASANSIPYDVKVELLLPATTTGVGLTLSDGSISGATVYIDVEKLGDGTYQHDFYFQSHSYFRAVTVGNAVSNVPTAFALGTNTLTSLGYTVVTVGIGDVDPGGNSTIWQTFAGGANAGWVSPDEWLEPVRHIYPNMVRNPQSMTGIGWPADAKAQISYPVPEPGTLMLLGSGLLSLGIFSRRRRRSG